MIHLEQILTIFFFGTLLAASIGDARCLRISDRIHLVILSLAWVGGVGTSALSISARIAGFFCVSAPMLLVSLVSGGGIGGGDIKLMAVCGAFLGWKCVLLSAWIGLLLAGMIQGIFLCAGRRKRKDRFALGPFLCMGMTLTWLLTGHHMI